MRRRKNGEGTIFQRSNGSWTGQTKVTLTNGAKERVTFTDKSYEAVRKWMRETQYQESCRIPFAEKDWTVAEYLDYWLTNIQSSRIRETTMSMYKQEVRNHINPTLGNLNLQKLSMYDVRSAMDTLRESGCGGASMQKCYQILSSCLSCAMREELIHRNVAKLVEKPKYTPKETVIWTVDQAVRFLKVAQDHPQRIAFFLSLTYGMRRGEVLGLRWCDIDFENNLIHVRQQIDRIDGKLMARELKTANSRRVLPLLPAVRTTLLAHVKKHRITMPPFNPYFELSTSGTVVISEAGTPLEPRNYARCFHLLTKKAGLPRIKIHAMRHTAATLLKDLNVPIKDVQLILGHANVSTTLNIYQHGTPETHRTSLTAAEARLTGCSLDAVTANTSVQPYIPANMPTVVA